MMRMMIVVFATLLAGTGQLHAAEAGALVGFADLSVKSTWDTVAVAPITSQEAFDGLRATVNYFENLADSASTPLLMFLPTHAVASRHDECRDRALQQLQQMGDDLRPRWVVFANIGNCETSDHATKAFWREAGWVWSGRARAFCVPKARAVLKATITIVAVDSAEVVAESEIEATGERGGPMIQLPSSNEALRCASSPALHAKAKGAALRDLGVSLAYEVDRLLGTVIFQP